MASTGFNTTEQVMDFKGLEKLDSGVCNAELVFRLIHFWEARNFNAGNVLMGLELLFLDSKSNAAQGFIPANKVSRYQDYLEIDAVYKLKKFILNPTKTFYRVADNRYNIIFTARTSLVKIPEGNRNIGRQRFRIRSYADLSITVDTHTDLFDVLGEIRLVKGESLRASIPEPATVSNQEKSAKDSVFLHLFMSDGETVRVYLWGDTAAKFRERWNKTATQSGVLLITTVNPKTVRGALTLSSTPATRLFFDTDVPETEAYMYRLHHGGLPIPLVTASSSAITRLETVTIGELHEFVRAAHPQSASFFVYATIVDVSGGHSWRYISCINCSTKLVNSGTTMYCPRCDKNDALGVFRYRLEITVTDMSGTGCTFVLFDRDAAELIGMKADAIIADSSSVRNEEMAALICPGVTKKILQKTFKFQIKVTPYNFIAPRQFFTVSRIMETRFVDGSVEDEGEPHNRDEHKHDAPTTLVVNELGDTSGTGYEPKRARLE